MSQTDKLVTLMYTILGQIEFWNDNYTDLT